MKLSGKKVSNSGIADLELLPLSYQSSLPLSGSKQSGDAATFKLGLRQKRSRRGRAVSAVWLMRHQPSRSVGAQVSVRAAPKSDIETGPKSDTQLFSARIHCVARITRCPRVHDDHFVRSG